MGALLGVTSPDPDGAGAMKPRAMQYSYNSQGQLWLEALGTVTDQSDAAWANFAEAYHRWSLYDGNGRVIRQTIWSNNVDYQVADTLYDALGRRSCTILYMDPAQWGPQASVCAPLQTNGPNGPDRVTQTLYDAAGEITDVKVGVGTADAATERHLTYSNNGLVSSLKDGENNLTTYEYDGFDRLSKTRYPSPTKGAGTSSTTDFEQLGYDSNGNVTSRRLRDGTSIAFSYDNLDRVTLKDLPGTEPDVTYGYDNLDRITSASQTGNAISFGYDALSRKTSETGPRGTNSFAYDAADEKTGITYATTGGGSALTINYAYLTTGELDTIKQGATVLADYSYDNLGNRTGVAFANGASQAFSYDPVSRLSQLTNSLTDANDLTATFSYNPASQIASTTRTGDMYAWTGHGNGSTAFTQNGLNQQTSVGGASATWDSKGNLTFEPQSGRTYGYSSENLLTSADGGVTLSYDPAMRLFQVVGTGTRKFGYDGLDAIAEYGSQNGLLHRYVFDPTTDQPVIWFEGTGVAASNRHYLSQDERGSVISISDSAGASLGINTYDEYGKPGATNTGRFQYTGQKWIGNAELYDYKARDYVPQLGVFAQTDPIGYKGDGPNLHAYVLNDPVNFSDPLGLSAETCGPREKWGVPTGSHIAQCYDPSVGTNSGTSPNWVNIPPHVLGGGGFVGGGWVCTNCGEPSTTDAEGNIVVTAPQYEWVPDIQWQFAQTDLNPLRAYLGEPAGALHWYVDQLPGGAKYYQQRVQDFEDRCLSGNDVDPKEVALSSFRGAAKALGRGRLWDQLVSGVIGGWRTQARRVIGGAMTGAATSVARQKCGI